jgi:hypothetical protein
MSIPLSILPPGDGDFPTIAALEAAVFDSDPISVYSFGPSHNSPAALHERAISLATPPPANISVRLRKAVTEDGVIVGFALWKFYEQNDQLSLDTEDGLRETGTDSGLEKAEENKWPEGANVELCEAVFGRSDEHCKLSMRGKKYAGTFYICIYSPSF